jgi:hypothetical protein
METINAIVRAETRLVRRAETRRFEARRADGTVERVTEVTFSDAYVWREGGEARAARLLDAIARGLSAHPHPPMADAMGPSLSR